jgi:predicted MPP superfamily phosphohydrolase
MSIGFVVTAAVFLGLLFFLVQEIRRPVRDSRWDHTPRRYKRLRIVLIAILLFGLGIAIWGFFIEPNRLVTRYQTIELEQWPRELSDLRIAVLSDIHAGGRFIDERKLRLIVERTNELQPDLIVILGDYISGGRNHHAMDPEVFAPALKDFHAPLGVYTVLGNHDWWFNGERVRSALEANGLKVLENDAARIDARGTSFWLVGLPDLWTRTPRIPQTLAKVPEGAPMIAMAHNPDIFPQLPQRVSLLLAGHTHGGQVKFPLIGTVVHTTDFGDHYEAGHVFENGHHLFVTTGIGTSIIAVRFRVPPEIVLLTVKSKSGT